MHPIKAFKTSDGRIFASESDAAHHEVKTEMVSWFKEQGLDKGAFSVGELVRVMLKDSAHFALLLTGYARAQPRRPAGLEGIIVQRLKAQPLRINGTATSHQAKNGSSLGYVQASILAPDIRITGDIKGEGDVSIEGPLDGNVTARCVTVGPEGHVTGSIKAERVVISGTVQGDVKAGEVSFSASSKFKGTVTVHEFLEVERGARFEGKTVWASTGAAKVAALESFANSGRKPGNGSATQSNGGVSQIKSGSSDQARITAR